MDVTLSQDSTSGESAIWDIAMDKRLMALHVFNAYAIAFSPDGARVAVAGHLNDGDNEVTVWKIAPEPD